MRPLFRDVLATLFVGVSLVVYVAWATAGGLLGFTEVRSVTGAILVLGIAASMLAVVPAFNELVHGSRLYLALASAAGVIALIAGLWALLTEQSAALATLVVATIVMWAMSTLRHARVHRPGATPRASMSS